MSSYIVGIMLRNMAKPMTIEEANRRLVEMGKADSVRIVSWVGYSSRENLVECLICDSEPFRTYGRNLIGTAKPSPFSGCATCRRENPGGPERGGSYDGIPIPWRDAIESLILEKEHDGGQESYVARIRAASKRIARSFSALDITDPSMFELNQIEDWLSNDPSDIHRQVLFHILRNVGNGLIVAIVGGRIPSVYWNRVDNRIEYMQHVAVEQSFDTMESWLGLRKEMFSNSGFANWYQHNDMSIFDCVSDLFSDAWPYHEWEFESGPGSGFWSDVQNRTSWRDWFAQQMHWPNGDSINEENEHYWLNFSRSLISKHNGWGILKLYRRTRMVLSSLFEPEYTFSETFWENWNANHYSLGENLMDTQIRSLLEIETDSPQMLNYPVRLSPYTCQLLGINQDGVRYSSGGYMEMDRVIPDLNLAFEYHGPQHYHFAPFFHKCEQHYSQGGRDSCDACLGLFESQIRRDSERREVYTNDLCYTLIEVPYTWDGTLESLRQIIENSGLVLYVLISTLHELSSQ